MAAGQPIMLTALSQGPPKFQISSQRAECAHALESLALARIWIQVLQHEV